MTNRPARRYQCFGTPHHRTLDDLDSTAEPTPTLRAFLTCPPSHASHHNPPRRRLRGVMPWQAPVARRTDPSLYQWERLTTAQQQAVLQTIRLSQRGGTGRIMRVMVVLLIIVGLLAAFAVLAFAVLHLSGFTALPG